MIIEWHLIGLVGVCLLLLACITLGPWSMSGSIETKESWATKITWIDFKFKALSVYDWIDAHPWPALCVCCLIAGIIIGVLI